MTEKQVNKNAENIDSKANESIELGMLVYAKKMGLSFEELNLFSVGDFVNFIDIWTGDEGDGDTRQATQADIEKYMG